MIDTLARHIAALSEARRLVAMILANNPAFKALLHANAGRQTDVITHLEGLLGGDKVYLAYRQLGEALAEVQPASVGPAPTPVTLSEAVALLPTPVPATKPATPGMAWPCLSTPCDSTLVSQRDATAQKCPGKPPAALKTNTFPSTLGDRLRDVLEATSMPASTPAQPTAGPVLPGAKRDEATVAIVRREPQAISAPQIALPVRAAHPPSAPKAARRLFPSL